MNNDVTDTTPIIHDDAKPPVERHGFGQHASIGYTPILVPSPVKKSPAPPVFDYIFVPPSRGRLR